MKTFFTLALLFFIGTSSSAQVYYVYTAKGSGQWNNIANWNVAPRVDGKKKNKVVIPKNITIVADNLVNSMGLGDVEINVAGRITLQPSTTLTLGANSQIELAGGDIVGNSTTQRIVIGTVVKYNGALDQTKAGFSYADNTTGVAPNGFFTPVILAVKFESFTATKKSNSDVQLTWVTSEEVNNKYFAVQKSDDGKSWKQIAAVFPQATSSGHKTYSYADKNAGSSTQYYRIAQVDIDGSLTYSGIRSVSTDKAPLKMKAYASGSNSIVIESEANGGSAKVSLIAMNGQVLVSSTIKHDSKILLTTNKSLTGIYIVRMEQADGTIGSQKIML